MTPEKTPDSESRPDPEPDHVVELRRLASAPAETGRARVAKLGALRTLERLNRGGVAVAPMPESWHPSPGSKWEALDAHDSRETRERWWQALQVRR